MNWIKRKFWMWWFFKCPIGYSFMEHHGGDGFYFYKWGIAIRYDGKYKYVLIGMRGRKVSS